MVLLITSLQEHQPAILLLSVKPKKLQKQQQLHPIRLFLKDLLLRGSFSSQINRRAIGRKRKFTVKRLLRHSQVVLHSRRLIKRSKESHDLLLTEAADEASQRNKKKYFVNKQAPFDSDGTEPAPEAQLVENTLTPEKPATKRRNTHQSSDSSSY